MAKNNEIGSGCRSYSHFLKRRGLCRTTSHGAGLQLPFLPPTPAWALGHLGVQLFDHFLSHQVNVLSSGVTLWAQLQVEPPQGSSHEHVTGPANLRPWSYHVSREDPLLRSPR